MNGEKIQNIDTTKTIVLECNNKDSIKTQSVGVGSRRLTALDNAIWTNNFQSIPIKKGDQLTMEYAIINQVGGGQADTMEFNVNKVLDNTRQYNDNSVVFETEFYLNHNGINSLGMPYTDTANNNIATIIPYATPIPPVPPATEPDYSISLHYGQIQLNGIVNTINTEWEAPNDWSYSNCWALRGRNRLQQVDTKRYTKMNGFDPYEDIGISPATYKRYIQFKIEDSFLTPDTLANKLNLKFHNTNVNLQKQPDDARASTRPDGGATRYPINFNKDIVVSTPANGITITGGITTEIGVPTVVANFWEQFFVKDPERWIGGTNLNYCYTNYLEGDTDLFAPSPAIPQLHPRLISRWSLNGAGLLNQMPHQTTLADPTADPPVLANNSAIYEEYMPIFTSIEYSGDNMDNLDKFLKGSHLYYGNLTSEEKALKIDQPNFTTWCDLGRSNDSGSDIGQPLIPNGLNALTILNQTCPTIDGQNTGEAGAGISCVGVNPFWINDYAIKTKSLIKNDAGDEFFFDDDRIELVFHNDLPAQTQEARRRNIGAYPYQYTFTDGTTALLTYFLVSKQGQVRSEKRDMRRTCSPTWFGFSPSAYDNHYIQPMNPDLYSFQTPDVWSINEIRANMNFINVGAFDVNIQYDLALSRFGIFNLHTERKFGLRDDYTGSSNLIGESIVKINEPIWLGVANPVPPDITSTQANFGRNEYFLDIAIPNTPVAPAGLEANPVPFTQIHFNQVWTGRNQGQYPNDRVWVEMNQHISDSVCGVFIKNVYFGGKGFIADQYSSDDFFNNPDLLNKITTRATADNWYGSILWKMGALYEDFYPQFIQGCRSLRFNDIYYRNLNPRIKSTAPLTTNAQMDTSIIQSINMTAHGTSTLLAGLTIVKPKPPTVATIIGVSNFQLGYTDGMECVLAGVDSRGMFFSGSIHRAETGFYRVYTNFASPEYLTAEGGDLNVIGLALKSYNSADFYYSYSPSYSITADKDFVLTNIETQLRDSDGNIANVGDRCVVVYKITKSKEIPILNKIHKSPEEEGLEKIENELEELNYNTKMNNIIDGGGTRGGFGASMGGGATSGGINLPFGADGGGEPRALGGMAIDPVAPQSGIPESAVGGFEARVLEARKRGRMRAELINRELPLRRTGDIGSIIQARREEERRAFQYSQEQGRNEEQPIRADDLTAGSDISQFLNNVMRAGIETSLNRTPLPVNRDGDLQRGGYIDRLLARVVRTGNNAVLSAIGGVMGRLSPDMTEDELQRVAEEMATDINGIEVNRQGRVLLGVPLVSRATVGDLNSRNFNIQLSDNGLEYILNILHNPDGEGENQGRLIEAVGNLLGDGNIQIQRGGENIMVDTGATPPSKQPITRGRLPKRVSGLVENALSQNPEDPATIINIQINKLLDNPVGGEGQERELRDLQQALNYLSNARFNISRGGQARGQEQGLASKVSLADELFNKTRIKLDPRNPNFTKDLKQINNLLEKRDIQGALQYAESVGEAQPRGRPRTLRGLQAQRKIQDEQATKTPETESDTKTAPQPANAMGGSQGGVRVNTDPEPPKSSGGGGGRM